jgi:hypothetical protein
VAVWSTIHGQNGFAEVAKMLQGQPAFIVIDKPGAELGESQGRISGGGERTNPEVKDDVSKRTASDDIRDRAT